MIPLSAVSGYAPISVLRDGAFDNLGFLPLPQGAAFVFLEDTRFLRALLESPDIRAVLTTPQLAGSIPAHLALAVCDQPRLAFAQIHNELARQGFYWTPFESTIDPSARIHPSASIAPNNVRIGPGVIVDPHANILERCIVGARVVIGAGCVLGGVGFQTVRTGGAMFEMEHAGGLRIEEGVRILPGAVVATGLFRQETILGRDARIGSLAFVSHGVHLGPRARVGHGAVVNGGVVVGQDAWIGPGAVLAQGLHIGDAAFISLGSAVIRDVPAGAHVSGAFAASHRSMLRFLSHLESGGTSP